MNQNGKWHLEKSLKELIFHAQYHEKKCKYLQQKRNRKYRYSLVDEEALVFLSHCTWKHAVHC